MPGAGLGGWEQLNVCTQGTDGEDEHPKPPENALGFTETRICSRGSCQHLDQSQQCLLSIWKRAGEKEDRHSHRAKQGPSHLHLLCEAELAGELEIARKDE